MNNEASYTHAYNALIKQETLWSFKLLIINHLNIKHMKYFILGYAIGTAIGSVLVFFNAFDAKHIVYNALILSILVIISFITDKK